MGCGLSSAAEAFVLTQQIGQLRRRWFNPLFFFSSKPPPDLNKVAPAFSSESYAFLEELRSHCGNNITL